MKMFLIPNNASWKANRVRILQIQKSTNQNKDNANLSWWDLNYVVSDSNAAAVFQLNHHCSIFIIFNSVSKFNLG